MCLGIIYNSISMPVSNRVRQCLGYYGKVGLVQVPSKKTFISLFFWTLSAYICIFLCQGDGGGGVPEQRVRWDGGDPGQGLCHRGPETLRRAKQLSIKTAINQL